MEKKGKWATIGRLGHKGRGVSISQLLNSRQITRDEAVAMVGDKIAYDFDQELKIAGNRLQRIGEQQYLAQAGKAFVKIELVNSLVYQDTYELSDNGLRYLRARIEYAATDIYHDGNDEFAI